MRKKERQALMVRLLTENEITTQADLVALLRDQKIEVTQATVSRDIKEMKLVKIPFGQGAYRYCLPEETAKDSTLKLDTILKEAFLSVEQMAHYVVLRTIPGSAIVSKHLIERQYKAMLFAIINDDDRVLMIAKSVADAENLHTQFLKYR